MTKEQVKELPLGLYVIYWKEGGCSLAAVGNLHDGSRWIAPTNWTNESSKNIAHSGAIWRRIKYVKNLVQNKSIYE